MMISRRIFLGTAATAVAWPHVGLAASLPEPSGDVLLEVTGAISKKNSHGAATFDRKMMTSLDWVEIETFTSFTDGPQRFAGPTLVSLLEAVGAEGTTLHATAINDYTVRIPVEHAARHGVILAMDMNGVPMRVRDKGPIWVVYPLTEAEAEKKPFDDQMIWQLARIRID